MNQRKPVSIFEQFGFKTISKSGDQSIGNCPFCGSSDHFFVNLDHPNKPWDCKKCLKSGGYKKFIDKIVEFTSEHFTKITAAKLIKNRGISFITLKNAKIGYHPFTKKYVIPSITEKGEVSYIKIFNFNSMISGSGCHPSIYGLNFFKLDKCKLIYICEGEWDGLALKEIITQLKLTNIGILAVPSAGTFKTDMLQIFNNKNVVLLYDNDNAGREGTKKAESILQPIAAKVHTIEWPKGTEDGYDIRDLKNALGSNKAYEFILENIKEVKQEVQKKVVYKSEPIDCNKVYDKFRKWLYLPDTTIIDIIFGTVLANRIPGDPVWMFVVGPPGGGKSEPIRALTDCTGIKVLTTLTPQTLISGMGRDDGRDASWIPLLNNNTLIIKDFTPLLSLPVVYRDEIMSVLRDAYDGECAKAFGNGVYKKYKSTFGIIAAVTNVIETFTESNAKVGERFLRWKINIPMIFKIHEKYVNKSFENLTHEKEMREELHNLAVRILDSNYDFIPDLPSVIKSKITNMAILMEILRSDVERDKYTKDILHSPFVGIATRSSKELIKLAYGIGQFRGLEVITKDIYKILVHVMKSSVTSRSIDILGIFYKKQGKLLLGECSKIIKLPVPTCQLVLDNFVALCIAEREMVDNKILYKMSKEVYNVIKECELFD